MWRFIEEGPRLKFPLKNSPFMAADPMYREVRVAPPLRFQRYRPDMHSSFLSSGNSEQHTSSNTVEMATDMDGIPPISKGSISSTGSETNPIL